MLPTYCRKRNEAGINMQADLKEVASMSIALKAVADLEGGSLGQLSPHKPLWRPLEWRPFFINASFLVPMEVETEIKI